MAKHILLIDDDALLRRSLAFSMERAGYRMSTASTAEDALALAQRDPPDLVLLDIGLPGMDGLDALQHFVGTAPAGTYRASGRLSGRRVPVIFVSARRRELDQVLGLELGADDYVTKPFDLDVLLARVKAVLRRAGPRADGLAPVSSDPQLAASSTTTPLVVGDLTIDPEAHRVTCGGKPVELPPREFDVLFALALDAGRVISVDDLVARVWGAEYEGEPQVAYVHIRWLRQKIEEDPHQPRRLITVRGVGYKLEPQPGPVPSAEG